MIHRRIHTLLGGITRRPEFSLPAEAKHDGWPSPAESTSNRAGLCKPNGVVAYQTLGPWQFVVAQHRSSLLDYYDHGFDGGVPNAKAAGSGAVRFAGTWVQQARRWRQKPSGGSGR